MNHRYLNIFLIICIISSFGFMCCGCTSVKKKAKIIIKHESKLSKIKKKSASQGNIINLSEGPRTNYDFRVGPTELSSPSFNIVNVSMP